MPLYFIFQPVIIDMTRTSHLTSGAAVRYHYPYDSSKILERIQEPILKTHLRLWSAADYRSVKNTHPPQADSSFFTALCLVLNPNLYF
jgi:hypothetical protein